MAIFKNKNFIKRDYECTNVVFCESESAPDENWIEVDRSEMEKTTADHIFTKAGVRYFGWL